MKQRMKMSFIIVFLVCSIGWTTTYATGQTNGIKALQDAINYLASQVTSLQTANQTLTAENERLGKQTAADCEWTYHIPRDEIIGDWQVIGFVDNVSLFDYTKTQWSESISMYLHSIEFSDSGTVKMNFTTGETSEFPWMDDVIMMAYPNPANSTANQYLIREHEGQKYMFFEWKSGDYLFRNMKLKYYVLKKTDNLDIGSVPLKYTTDITSSGIRINSWIAKRVDSEIQFTVNYDNDTKRKCTIFDPPNGNIFMVRGNLEAGRGKSVTLSVPLDQVRSTNEITMKFFLSGTDERNFIYMRTDQLSEMLD